MKRVPGYCVPILRMNQVLAKAGKANEIAKFHHNALSRSCSWLVRSRMVEREKSRIVKVIVQETDQK